MSNNSVRNGQGLFLPNRTNGSPTDGEIWYETGTGFQFRQLGSTTSLGGGGSGGITVNSVVTTTHSIATGSRFIPFDATSAGFTATLPTASGVSGTVYYLQKIAGDTTFNLVTIATTGGETIGGFSSFLLATFGQTLTIVSNGTNWLIVDHKTDTPWTSYSMTIGATTSAPTKGTTTRDAAFWRRKADVVQVKYDYVQNSTSGAASGTGNYTFALPTGLAADTNKITADTSGTVPIVGVFQGTQGTMGTAENLNGIVQLRTTTLMQLWGIPANTTNASSPVASTFLSLGANASLTYSFFAEIPIANWMA